MQNYIEFLFKSALFCKKAINANIILQLKQNILFCLSDKVYLYIDARIEEIKNNNGEMTVDGKFILNGKNAQKWKVNDKNSKRTLMRNYFRLRAVKCLAYKFLVIQSA